MAKKSTYEESEHRPKEVATEAVERNRTERGEGKSEEPFLANKSLTFIAGILILFGLYISSLYSYLLFHTLAEVFSIVVACGIFVIAWNSRRILDNNYLLFLGIAYLFIGVLDLVHTLGYTGMGIFQGYDTNLPAQLWIATRYMESLSLLIAPLFLARKLKANLVLMAYALATFLVLGSVFYWHIFPTCFVEGVGLTPFKKISEYIISIILLGAITLLFQKRKEFDERVFRLLAAAMAMTIAAELAFTLYIHAYGFSNMVGHYLKIISFYLIYKAIIETGLVRPYTLLFRNLKQSEESLRLQSEITSHLSEGVYLTRVSNGVILYTNPRFEEIFGYGPGEMVGKHVSIVNAPTEMTPKETVDHIVGIMKKTGSWRGEIQNIRRNGTPFWCYTSASIYDHPEYGEIIISVHAGITERRKIEKELQETQRELDIIFNSVPALIWSKNNEGKYLQVNRAYCETVGLAKEKILGRTDYDLYPTDIANQYYKYDQEIINSKKPVLGIEECHLKPSGDYGWSLTDKLPYHDAESNTVSTIGFAIDISERKQAEEALRESEERFRTVADFTYDWEYWIAPDGQFIYVSPSCERITGYSPEEFMNDPGLFKKIVHPDDHSMVVSHIHGEQNPGELFSFDFRIITRSGEERWICHNCQPVHGIDGRHLGRRGSNCDISNRKQMEEELLKVKKLESLGVLAGGIAHQFNNALSSITSHTGLLETEYPEDEKIMDYAKAMKQSAHRMAHLTSQLLAYARGGQYNPQPMSLSELVEGALSLIQHTLDSDIRLETDLRPDVMDVEVDRTQMQMVLSAIVANSNEAIEPPGRIRISTKNMNIDQRSIKVHPGLKPGPHVCLSIEDNGKGMDQETKERIFEPFFTTNFIGRGLGMASVYGIITNQNGSISVASEPGKGTAVTIYLPALEAKEEV